MPAYSCPRNRKDLDVLRVVVRTGNVDLLDLLLEDVERLLPELEAQYRRTAVPGRLIDWPGSAHALGASATPGRLVVTPSA